jgi:hypothetical protein
VVGREHGAESGQNDIEARIAEGKIFRIGDLEGDL